MRRRLSAATASRVDHTATTRCFAETRRTDSPVFRAWGRRRPPSWCVASRISTGSSPAASSATTRTRMFSVHVELASRSASRPFPSRKGRGLHHRRIRKRSQNSVRPTALARPSTAWSVPWPDRPPASARGRVRLAVTDRGRPGGPLSFLLDPIALQRLEGGMLLVLSLVLFWKYSGVWLLYVVLILAPDLFMLGYLRGPQAGAALYNLGHTWLLPGLLGIVALLASMGAAGSIALIWFGHIGGDRLLGYGLQLPAGLQDTPLRPIGRNR